MGYTTEFTGVLKFTSPLTAEQELALSSIIPYDGYEHTDDHPEWIKPEKYRGYVQMVIAPDKSGIQWDGNEKFYGAVDAINTVIMTMKSKFPDFGLDGHMLAQGEEIGDVWSLAIQDGVAKKFPIEVKGAIHECPDCGHKWIEK